MITKKKSDYQSWIHMYEGRKDIIRKKYGVKERYKAPPEYHKAVKRINMKIRVWKVNLKKIETRELWIEEVRYRLIEFCGSDVQLSNSKNRYGEVVIARYLFYKYCLENATEYFGGTGRWWASYLSTFTGAKRIDTVREARRRFTKSFATNPTNKDIWRRFVLFMKDYEEEIAA